MYSYMSQFFGGELDPTWPHAILILGCIVGGALVGLGVILEAPKILSIPVAAVFVGVVIEAVCTLLLFGFDEGISTKQQSQLAIAIDRATDAGFDATVANNAAADANERAAQLEKDAAVARAAIADANARAAEASQKAAEAQLALEKFKTPRVLKLDQQQRIADKLRQFAPQPFALATLVDPEVESLMYNIESVLLGSNWSEQNGRQDGIVIKRPGRPDIGVVAVRGVYIQIDSTRRTDFSAPMDALKAALEAEGIEDVEAGAVDNARLPNVIHVMVGTKHQ
jgi:hypothetical protein